MNYKIDNMILCVRAQVLIVPVLWLFLFGAKNGHTNRGRSCDQTRGRFPSYSVSARLLKKR